MVDYAFKHTHKIRQWATNLLHKLIHNESSPASVALGFALGTFIAILPTPGFGLFVGLAFTFLFKSINRVSLIVSMTLWNPLVLVPLYYASYLLGSFLLSKPIDFSYEPTLYDLLYEYSSSFLLGDFILASVFTLISYVLVYRAVAAFHRKKQLRLLLDFYDIKSSSAA